RRRRQEALGRVPRSSDPQRVLPGTRGHRVAGDLRARRRAAAGARAAPRRYQSPAGERRGARQGARRGRARALCLRARGVRRADPGGVREVRRGREGDRGQDRLAFQALDLPSDLTVPSMALPLTRPRYSAPPALKLIWSPLRRPREIGADTLPVLTV